MSKLNFIEPVYVYYMPDEMEEGILYISEEFRLAIHLCACGCGIQTVCNLHKLEGWTLTKNGDKVTLRPSIGNFRWEHPYHAHYYITDNKIQWL